MELQFALNQKVSCRSSLISKSKRETEKKKKKKKRGGREYGRTNVVHETSEVSDDYFGVKADGLHFREDLHNKKSI